MAYTVKKLAALSGVSVRTLHFYDEIGLLKPARYGDNGYRYYDEHQLLILQQILFFKELGFPLSEIQKVIQSPDFDKVAALESHRKLLEKNVARSRELIQTIDNTLSQLKGGARMKDEEIYLGFDRKKQEEYESEITAKYGAEKLEESKKRTANWQKDDYEAVKIAFEDVHKSFTAALIKNLKPRSDEVQEIVRSHYRIIRKFYEPTLEVYRGLGELYVEHPDFRKMYDSYHPDLAVFMKDAMKAFAERELS